MSLKADFVDSLGPYYHVTSPEAWDNIQKDGLQPKDFGIGYSSLAPREDPLICFTAHHRKGKWLSNFCDDHDVVIRLEVPSSAITSRDFSLDYTSSETEHYLSSDCNHSETLKKSGDVACYDHIPASEISDHEEIDCSKV